VDASRYIGSLDLLICFTQIGLQNLNGASAYNGAARRRFALAAATGAVFVFSVFPEIIKTRF
jgi:hypothetical protein